MINKMPGDDWQKFANLRALYAMTFTYPGKKLSFMGSEIAQYSEWQHGGSVHWDLLEEPKHSGILDIVRELNQLYRDHPALHETDCSADGFEWIDCSDSDQSVVAFYRYSADRSRSSITICNYTPVIRRDYLIGVNEPGHYVERINSDAERYGGSGQSNSSNLITTDMPCHGRPFALSLTLPPLAVLILELQGSELGLQS